MTEDDNVTFVFAIHLEHSWYRWKLRTCSHEAQKLNNSKCYRNVVFWQKLICSFMQDSKHFQEFVNYY